MTVKRTPGVRAGLTREQILDAALQLIDRDATEPNGAASGTAGSADGRRSAAERDGVGGGKAGRDGSGDGVSRAERRGRKGGLAGLTMRGLGAALGVEAMTLYHYFPTKNALIDGLTERILTAAAQPAAGVGDWRAQLYAYAESLRTTLLAHPAILPVIARPAVTPATLDTVESMLRELVAAGFPLGRAIDALNALTVFVIGHAGAEAAIGDAGPPTGLDPERHPLLLEAAQTGAGSDDHQRFQYAVRALLTGLAPEV